MKIKKLLIFIILILAIWFFAHVLTIFVIGFSNNIEKADVILIFGNKVETSGQPSERLQSRLDKGLELYNQDMAPTIIVSGGFGKEGYDEAKVMKEYLVENGIQESAVIEDNSGANTYLTVKFLKEFSQNNKTESVIIVSQYYHLLRAKLTLNKFGFERVYGAHAQMFPELRDFYSIPREVVGYYAYLFK